MQYRQKGQLKLENTILEEFLPRLFDIRLVPGFARLQNIVCGPQQCFSHLSFGSPFLGLCSGGIFIKNKDQDFSVTKSHRVIISDLPDGIDKYQADIYVSYFATEIKTNLDKTMFQEASMTAGELKDVVPGTRYILLCEYLDMSPIDTKLTPIDEVIILRKAKRISSNMRSNYSTAQGRLKGRNAYLAFLDANPLRQECFERFLDHLRQCFPDAAVENENIILGRGYF
ncbi:MAG: Bpu10I family restriction endonuclease [Armatimonadetes bacterium]|nr:Bpu10I family restriction endonuclease [Armatimonadota bacterium]